MNNRLLSWLFMSLVIVACNQNRVYEKYTGLDRSEWLLKDTLSYSFDPIKSTEKGIVAIKYTIDYPYRNLYLKYILADSLGTELQTEMVNISMFEANSGKPVGKGFGSTFTIYDTLSNINFPKKATQLKLVQYMRVEELEGIEAVGFKIIKK